MNLSKEQRERLISRTDRARGHWMWGGTVTSTGYANCTVGGKTTYVQRALWEDLNGEVPKGHRLFNTCGERLCVRPEHWTAQPFGL